jgi:hypothetical protein
MADADTLPASARPLLLLPSYATSTSAAPFNPQALGSATLLLMQKQLSIRRRW